MSRKPEAISTVNRLDRWKYAPRPVPIHQSMVLDAETKYVTLYPDVKKFPRIELMVLTDLQFGSIAFREDRFIEYRSWLLSKPNRFVVLGGDLIDAATPISIASPYDNRWEPSEQIYRLIELLSPLQPRIWGSVGGNHERRTAKTYGDAGLLIGTLLKIPYSRGVQFLDIHYGRHDPFKISLWHGRGAARTKGARAQMVHDFMRKADSQVYLCGHLHDALVLFDWRQKRDGKGHIHLEKIAGIMSSSFQDYWNTYSEVVGLPPSDTMMARLILEQSGGWEVTLR